MLILTEAEANVQNKQTLSNDANTPNPTVLDTDKQTQLVRARARAHTSNSLEPSIASTAPHAHAPRA